MKKWGWMCLALALLLAVATACSQGSSGGNESEGGTGGSNEEAVTLKFVFPGDYTSGMDDVFGALNEKSLAEINTAYSIEYVPWSDYGTKRNLYMQTGETFDGTLVWESELQGLWANGGLVALNDYISEEKTPNLLNVIPLQAFKDMAIDGQYTNFPSIVTAQNWYVSYIIRGDLREKYGMEPITTLEQLEQYFAHVKENEPGVIPVSVVHDYLHLGRVFGQAAFVGPNAELGGPAYVDPQQPDRVSNWIESDLFQTIAETKRRWAVNGWQNPDVLVPGTDVFSEFKAGRIAAVTHDITQADHMNNTKLFDEFRAETVILNPDAPGWRNFWGNNLVVVSKTSQHPERVVRWVDWLFSDRENYATLLYGLEGVHREIVGDTVRPAPGAEEGAYPSWNQWYWAQGVWDYHQAHFTEETKRRIEHFLDFDAPIDVSPTLGLTMDLSPVNTQATQLSEAWNRYGLPLMAGIVEFDEYYPQLVKAYDDAGVDAFLAEAQKQYDAWRSAR